MQFHVLLMFYVIESAQVPHQEKNRDRLWCFRASGGCDRILGAGLGVEVDPAALNGSLVFSLT